MPFKRVANATITNLQSGNQIEVKELRITFAIKKKRKGDENEAVISIYNLNELSRGAIQSDETKGGDGQTLVELRAGYVDSGDAVLFRGIGTVVSEWVEPNWVTKIEATDGATQLSKLIFEKQYVAGIFISQIITDIIKASGLTVGRLVPPPGVLPRTRTFSGPPAKVLGDLSSTYDFTIDIQNEEASTQVGLVPTGDNVVLSIETGLIGIPVRRGTVVECQSVIIPALKPGASVTLLSPTTVLSGLYVLKSVDIQGDSWSGQWSMKLQMETPGVRLPFNLTPAEGTFA